MPRDTPIRRSKQFHRCEFTWQRARTQCHLGYEPQSRGERTSVHVRGAPGSSQDIYLSSSMAATQVISLLKGTYTKWSDHQAPRLGASVAFYSILSFAPLLVLITAVIALVLGHASAQGALVNEARQWIGDRGADTVQTLLKNAQKPTSGVFAGLVAFVTLLFGASGVFTELRDDLNLMWDAKEQTASGVIGMIKDRLFS